MPLTLIGNYLSPFTRRVAITMKLLDIPFTLETVLVWKTPDAVSAHNPVTRVPTLLLEDGEAILESGFILDYLDELVGPEKRMIPPTGKARRDVLRLVAVAIGATERAQWAFYEPRFRPEDKVHPPWIEHNETRCAEGLAYLDGIAKSIGNDGWLAGTDTIGQADISAAVAFSFTNKVRPDMDIASMVPSLARFTARCEAMDDFKSTPIP